MNATPGREIIVVGSLNADLGIYTQRHPQPGETLHGHGFNVGPGGKSANQAVAAAKLGGRVALIGAVGNDANGAMLLDSCRAAGVDVSSVYRRGQVETGVAVITVDASGENTIVISAGANGTLDREDVEQEEQRFAQAGVVCLCLEVDPDTVLAAAQAGQRHGATVLLNLSPYAEVEPALVQATDVLLVNVHEASQFLGGQSLPDAQAPLAAWSAVTDLLSTRGIRNAVITLGSEGSVVLQAGIEAVRIAPTKVKAIDTTGAGDAFTGALAARLAAGDPLHSAAAYASRSAALATTAKGTQAAYSDAGRLESSFGTSQV